MGNTDFYAWKEAFEKELQEEIKRLQKHKDVTYIEAACNSAVVNKLSEVLDE